MIVTYSIDGRTERKSDKARKRKEKEALVAYPKRGMHFLARWVTRCTYRTQCRRNTPKTPFEEVAGRSQIPTRSSLPQPCLLRNRQSPRREPLLGVHGVLIRLGSSKRAPVVKRIPCRFCKTPLTWPHRLAVRLALMRVLKAVVDGWETSPRARSVCVCNVPLMLSQRDGVDGRTRNGGV